MNIEELKLLIEKYTEKSNYFKNIGFDELSKDFEYFTNVAKEYLETKVSTK